MKKRSLHLLFLTLAIILIPSTAHADMGTPLILAGFFHVLIGNLFIGLGEGLLIAWLFKVKTCRWGWAVCIMILANYVSLIGGIILLPLLEANGFNLPQKFVNIYNVTAFNFLLIIATYIASIFLEWPFCYWIMKGKERRGLISLYASTVAQTASYILLVPLYMLVSTNSMAGLHLERDLSFVRESKAVIYYISMAGGDVYKINIDGTKRSKVVESNIKDRFANIIVKLSKDSKHLDLWVMDYPERDIETLLVNNIADASKHAAIPTKFPYIVKYFGDAIDLRPESQQDWKVNTGNWAMEGLHATNKKNGKSLHVAVETPFTMWNSVNATVLPGDQVVYQLDQQIVLLDLNTRKLGLITMGGRPVVVLNQGK